MPEKKKKNFPYPVDDVRRNGYVVWRRRKLGSKFIETLELPISFLKDLGFKIKRQGSKKEVKYVINGEEL